MTNLCKDCGKKPRKKKYTRCQDCFRKYQREYRRVVYKTQLSRTREWIGPRKAKRDPLKRIYVEGCHAATTVKSMNKELGQGYMDKEYRDFWGDKRPESLKLKGRK